jgi:hypothetical protein
LSKKGNFVNSTLVWGYNDSGEDHQETSVTLETNVQLQRLAVYGRYENVEKSASELVLEDFDDHDIFRIQALTAGLNYTFLKVYHTTIRTLRSVSRDRFITRISNWMRSMEKIRCHLKYI